MSKRIGPGWNGIVKVQQSMNIKGSVLIYDKTRSLMYEDEGCSELIEHMGKRLNVYYSASINKDRKIVVHTDTDVSQDRDW